MHSVLGARLNEICTALLALEIDDPYKIMGSVDGMKLRSSMTLFSLSSDNNSIFDAVLNKFLNIPPCGYRESGKMETAVPAKWKPVLSPL